VNRPPLERVVANVGCGPARAGDLPAYFDGWNRLRVDGDPAVRPDVIAELTDLSVIPDASVHAVWAAHCIEHLYVHQVPTALKEFHRVLRADGFLCVIVPDLQTVANYLVADRLHETLYNSNAGPVTPHDIIFGFGPAIAGGSPLMAHRCGFTPSMLQRSFVDLPFGEVVLRRRSSALELAAVARPTAAKDIDERMALMAALEL
jgi:hypothetical protein